MRILAAFAFSFSAAVFMGVYLPWDRLLLPLGAGLALAGGLGWLLLRRRGRLLRLRTALVLSGLAAGLVWTAAYTAVFFAPARVLDGRTVHLSGEVSGWPRADEDGGFSIPVRVEAGSGVRLTAVLYLDGQGADLRPGDHIRTVARCALGSRTFSGEEITYYTAKGIFLRAKGYGELHVQRPPAVSPVHWPALLSQALKEGIDAAFPAKISPLVRALVTGNRDSLTDRFTTSLQRAGLAHTVAVSGMHLACLSQMLTRLLGRGRRSTALAAILWAALFCAVAGYTPSVLRAAVMVVMLQAAPLLGRERDGATSLALALMLLLAWNPFSAAHVGLQLSFAAVAGILLVSDPVQDRLLALCRLDTPPANELARQLRKIPCFILSALSAALGASLFTVPLAALHFRTLSLISPLANLATLWAIGLVFLGGTAAGAAGCLLPALGKALALPVLPLAVYLERAVDLLARPAWAALPLRSAYYLAWLVFVYGLLLAGAATAGRKRLILPVCAGVCTLALVVTLTAMDFRRGAVTAAVLDVGQGQCVLLRTGNFFALVDCGGDSTEDPGDIAADCLQMAGRNQLELLVVSHFHADHASGVPQLLRRVRVSAVALPDVEEESPLRQEILAEALRQGTRVLLIREDTVLELSGERSVTLLAPLGRGTGSNELGLTVLVRSGERGVLLTGDMDGETEKLLLAHAPLDGVDLLVAGHHGSRGSTTQPLLEAVQPRLAVISAGKYNRYGHPARETLERLAEAGAEIYRTDLQGHVVVRLNQTS